MHTATFIFDKKEFTEEFHRIDAMITEAANATSGFLGAEEWHDPKTGRVSTVYYWESEEGLQQLMNNTIHREAKARYSEWLAGYRVEISQVVRSYGDGKIAPPCGAIV
ncbi:MAG: DUF4188 domain-containing protein [Burkholderiales bacterium]|nr:DUF4188 domain-containing protein [Burkholderiales bacterium]